MNRLAEVVAVLLIAAVASSCRTDGSTKLSEPDSIKQVLRTLPPISLNFENLESTLQNVGPELTIEREKGGFLYNLSKKDPVLFDKADYLVPIGKLFENATVLSIVFRDYYDYKDAIHIFNLAKPSLTPISSFIPFSVGGDAEDFWYTEVKPLNSLTYEIVKTSGRYSHIVTRDTTFIRRRETWSVTIDPITGTITRDHLKTEADLIQTK